MLRQYFTLEESQRFNISDIRFYELLGEGAYGKVRLAKRPAKAVSCPLVTKQTTTPEWEPQVRVHGDQNSSSGYSFAGDPFHWGARFSKKAFIPSFWSPLAKQRLNRSSS